MKKIEKNQHIYKILDQFIPEFKEYKDHDMWYEDVPYLHVGNFAEFLFQRIENFGVDDMVVKKVFQFINDVFSNDEESEEVKTLLNIQIFEKLCESQKTVDVSKKLLKGDALFGFNEVLKAFKPVT